ncbi:unnamed protein product [Moneuplotes crassus]|uniref:Uncharacterized protein n=1 Tax=Euplotes crassus TaxID=5936 RepID=A0AAD2CYQ4_EUPCR|nr:unnamed protein product [Moneuplotes crassus]
MPILHPEPALVHVSEKASYGLKNEHIHHGYRKNFNSLSCTLKTIFMWHNETVNIWSHLIGAIFFFWLILSAGFYIEPTVEQMIKHYIGYHNDDPEIIERDVFQLQQEIPKTPVYLFLFSAVFCMICSVVYHLLLDYSERVSFYASKLDFAGISLLICGSTCPPIYYTLYCKENELMRTLYLCFTILSCSGAFISMFSKTVSKPENKKWRAAIFVSCGVSPIYALTQFWLFRDPLTMPPFDPTFWLIGGATYIFGAYVYSIKYPESKYPGKFDHCGHSHNLWHCFVIAGAFIQFIAILQVYHARRLTSCPI